MTCSSSLGGSHVDGGLMSPTSCYTNNGLYCNPDSATCRPQAGLHTTCNFNEQCANGLCQGHQCGSLGAEGVVCGESACFADLYCDHSSSVCKPRKLEGATCESFDECADGLCKDSRCVASRPTYATVLSLACAG